MDTDSVSRDSVSVLVPKDSVCVQGREVSRSYFGGMGPLGMNCTCVHTVHVVYTVHNVHTEHYVHNVQCVYTSHGVHNFS